MLLPLVAGLATLGAAAGLSAFWTRRLPRSVCPSCGGGTEGVTLGSFARPLERLVRRRWCPACGWSGFGRRGPVLWARKGPVAHDSGFRWSGRPGAPAAGFRWAEPGEEAASERPAQLSGFRWGEEGSTPAVIQARGPEGEVRRLVRLRHAERTVGFRWGRGGPGRREPG